MKKVMQREVPGGFLHESTTFEEGMKRAVDNAADKRDVLNNSVFTLCPRGNWNMDTNRMAEALELGR
jgi:hypothetical protein